MKSQRAGPFCGDRKCEEKAAVGGPGVWAWQSRRADGQCGGGTHVDSCSGGAIHGHCKTRGLGGPE